MSYIASQARNTNEPVNTLPVDRPAQIQPKGNSFEEFLSSSAHSSSTQNIQNSISQPSANSETLPKQNSIDDNRSSGKKEKELSNSLKGSDENISLLSQIHQQLLSSEVLKSLVKKSSIKHNSSIDAESHKQKKPDSAQKLKQNSSRTPANDIDAGTALLLKNVLTLAMAQPAKNIASFSHAREETGKIARRLTKDIEYIKNHSDTFESNRAEKLKKQLAFAKKIDTLLSEYGDARATRHIKDDPVARKLSDELSHLIKQTIREKGKHHSSAEVQAAQESARTFSTNNEKSSITSEPLIDQPHTRSSFSSDSGSSMSNSFMKQFGQMKESSAIPSQNNPGTVKTPFAERLDEVLSKARITVRDGSNGSVSLKLNPEHLGSVHVELGLKDGILNARFLVESNEAKNALNESMSTLQDTFMKEGIALGSFEVNVRQEKHESFEEEKIRISLESLSSKREEAQQEYSAGQKSLHDGTIDLVI